MEDITVIWGYAIEQTFLSVVLDYKFSQVAYNLLSYFYWIHMEMLITYVGFL